MPKETVASRIFRLSLKVGVLGVGISLVGITTYGCFRLYKWTIPLVFT